MAKNCEIVCGFLIKHVCDYPATARCVSCGKGLCAAHSRPLDDPLSVPGAAYVPGPGEEAVICVECIKLRAQQQQQGQPGYWRDRWQDDPYFWGVYYHPYYVPYSGHHYYDEGDHGAFDRQPEGAYEADFAGT